MRLAFLLVAAVVSIAAENIQYNRDVRPILSDRCFACHGPDKGTRQANLRLDREEDAKTKLLNGEVYKRVTATGPRRMPPSYAGHDKLTDAQIDILRRWIEQGAKYEPHWSFQSPRKSPLPSSRNPVDAFVLARLEREGLKPSPPASKRTLIRRLTLDLTGLPPTMEDTEAFVRDESPSAYEKAVDRLLASTAYAERMAIRWLDAARYADTNGYQTDGPRDMWRWRDWVIDAYRHDMPYDQFTVEQIAGDLLPNATRDQKIATGFHRNHRTSAEGGIVDEEFRVEYVADRTETTATVWLGLTVGCARCHDHKFDPISQKEYYSMFAFFNSVPERGFVWNFGNEQPSIKAPIPEQQKQLDEYARNIEAAKTKLDRLQPKIEKAQAKWEKKLRSDKETLDWTVTEGQKLHLVQAGMKFDGKTFHDAGKAGPKFNYRDPFTFALWVNPETPTGALLSKGDDYSEGQQHGLYLMDGKLRLHVIFRWTDLGMRVETAQPLAIGKRQHIVVSYDGGMRASGVRMYVDGKQQELKVLFDQLLWPIDTKEPWRVGAGGGLRFQGSIEDVRVYDRALTPAEAGVLPLTQTIDQLAAVEPKSRSAAQLDKLRLCFLERFAPEEVNRARNELTSLTVQRDGYLVTVPSVMVMQDSPEPRDTFLLKRGAYDAPGDKVSPAVPAVLPAFAPDLPKNRLGLAKWLVDRQNPLTSRAYVNRVWAMLFGIGLVKTVDDFGSQGEWPAHQDLLDWLAVDFMDNGWRVKRLIKTIVMSSTYQQSSKVTPELLQRDPENRLLARGPRYRLPAEMIRDSALASSGLLVNKLGGPPVKPYQPAGLWQELQGGGGYKEDQGEGLYRRSLYTYWRRTVTPPNMANFDAPARETCTVRETRTNTPLQALNLMNDVTYVEAARKLAERMITEGGATASSRIEHAYKLVLARSPKPTENDALAAALRKFEAFYATHPSEAEAFVNHGKSPRRSGIEPPELASYTAIASIVLNSDEAITKE
ncbi:MAG TPA: DUF1553 domain-containing protein [Bryobacteraceae bacterium]|nr:DUF1553 domain-containing protein [Bryobacteraceae bacterium]